MAKKYTASLKDIAELSGVSISTVSRVINGKAKISPRTKSMVAKAADKLGYHSNMLIEGIKTGRTGIIGIMMPILDEFLCHLIYHIHELLIARSYLPINVWPDDSKSNEQALLKRLIEQRVEGIIMRPTADWAENDYFADVIGRGLPLVLVDRKLPAKLDCVTSDDYEGGRLAAEYLYKLGHRVIACYEGPQCASPALLRRLGAEDYIAEKSDATLLICGRGGWTDRSETVCEFLQKNPHVTAFTTFNDHYAVNVYDAALKLGLRIPDDLSVVGFGNLDRSNYVMPKLTTFDQFPDKLAQVVVEKLFNRIEQNINYPAEDIKIKPMLLEKQSCRPL